MKNEKFDPNETNKKIESAGVNPNTERAQKQAELIFLNFVKSKIDNHEDIFTNASILENLLIEFYETYRLNDNRLPSKSTLETNKSHIAGMIRRVTRNKFDIRCQSTFPLFSRLWKAKLMELKVNGRADVNHVKAIPDSVLEGIFKCLSILTKLMGIDEKDPSYDQLVALLPSSFRENYSKLVLHGAVFVFVYFVSFSTIFMEDSVLHFQIVSFQLCRRASEGVAFITKSHLAIQTFEKSGVRHFKKVLGESSKNHKIDSENLKNGGTIPFEPNRFRFNPRLFFHSFMEKNDPDAPYLFSHIVKPSKKFTLRTNPKVWFSKNKIGKNEVATALPSLSTALGLEYSTNQQLRPGAVRSLKRGKIGDRDIMKFTGHGAQATLENYDSILEEDRHLEMSRLISNGGVSWEPSRKRKASESSISMESAVSSSKVSVLSSNMEDTSVASTSKASVSSLNMEGKSAASTSNASTSSILEENTSIEDPLEVAPVEDYPEKVSLDQYDSDDSCHEVFTQEFTEEGVTQHLKKEQDIAEQQMEVFREQQRLMGESLKMRMKILSKKVKK